MKRAALTAVVVVLAVVVAFVSACRRSRGADVALLLSPHDARQFADRAARDGFAVATLDPAGDPAVVRGRVEAALAKGAKVLVIQPTDAVAAASYARLAHEHGAKVIAYERAIASSDLDYYVAHDSYRAGVLQAQAALAATHGKGRYVLLAGPAGNDIATEITRGYEDTLAPYVSRGDVVIVDKQHHRTWSADDAQRTVTAALARSGSLDAILANSSGLARGAVDAVAGGRSPHVFIAGADADAPNVNLVCEGKQALEILKNSEPLARTAADVAKALLAGAAPRSDTSVMLAGKQVPVSTVRVEVVTAETVKPLIVDAGILTADELPACKARLAVR
jgi:D-xylose transport system substrate-binding protein